MFTKVSLTIVTMILLVSMVACGAKSLTLPASNATQLSPQSSTSGTPTESDSADNYQMLPLISANVANVSLDATADGTTQQLKIGEVLSISLDSNTSTGYSWFATISNAAVLVQMGEPVYQETATNSSTPVLGAAGAQIFYFQATGTGTTSLTLDYKRSFETNVTPEKTFSMTVEVK